jgi:hypothetical protein
MPTATLSRRRSIGNSIAQRQGIPTTQAAVDGLWSGIVTRLNATVVPASRAPVGPSGERSSAAGGAKPTQASVDSMWTSLASELNAEAGLKTPARRAR